MRGRGPRSANLERRSLGFRGAAVSFDAMKDRQCRAPRASLSRRERGVGPHTVTCGAEHRRAPKRDLRSAISHVCAAVGTRPYCSHSSAGFTARTCWALVVGVGGCPLAVLNTDVRQAFGYVRPALVARCMQSCSIGVSSRASQGCVAREPPCAWHRRGARGRAQSPSPRGAASVRVALRTHVASTWLRHRGADD